MSRARALTAISDLAAALSELPAWSEFRTADADLSGDGGLSQLQRGRRVTVPNSLVPVSSMSGTMFLAPSVQPGPTAVVRTPPSSDEQDTVVSLSWDWTPGGVQPSMPLVYVLVTWGVGGVTYSRLLDVHRVPRRLAFPANFVGVQALLVDAVEGGVPANTESVDLVVAIGEGTATPGYWSGFWQPSQSRQTLNVTTAPAAVLAMTGTMVELQSGLASAYVMLLDTTAAPVTGALPVAGGVSPLLVPGQAFAFGDQDDPDLFCDRGVSWAISTTPDTYTAPTVPGSCLASVAVKLALNS